MTRILITAHGGSRNRGCEAIVRCTIDIINRYFGPTKITLMSWDPEFDRATLLPELKNIRIPDVVSRTPQKYSFRGVAKGIERRILRRIWPGIPSYFSIANRALYSNTDLLISVGGDNFGADEPSHFFGELALARAYGAITVIWAASIGPFRNSRLEKKHANALCKVDIITVREDICLNYLKGIGVVDNVRRVTDVAFLLPALSNGTDITLNCKSTRTVGIGMSALISSFGLSQDKYIEAFAAFGKTLLSDSNTQLVLISHVIKQGNDDESICRQLASRLPNDGRVTLIGRNLNASQTKHVIAQCDYFIGARTHSTIASLSSYVPTLSIGYSPKAYGINRDIFGHTDYVLPIANLNEGSLMEKWLLLCGNRNEIISHLRRQMPTVKRMANQNGAYLKELMRQHGR